MTVLSNPYASLEKYIWKKKPLHGLDGCTRFPNKDLTVRDTACTGDISGECTNYDTDVICKVKQSHVRVSIGCVEAAEAPVQPVADFVTAVWALQHRPLCLGQELRNQGQIAQAWKSK